MPAVSEDCVWVADRRVRHHAVGHRRARPGDEYLIRMARAGNCWSCSPGAVALDAVEAAVLFIDAAEAFGQWGMHERAYRALRAADEISPEEVCTRQTVRRLVADLVDRSPRTVKAHAREFAEQIGVDA